MDTDAHEEVRRQVWAGIYNRRVAHAIENGEREFTSRALGNLQTGEFFCTCGRTDCDEILEIPVEEHRFVREQHYRFLVAPGHATEVDEVIQRTDDYEVVEVKPAYRRLVEQVYQSVAAKLDNPESRASAKRNTTSAMIEAPDVISASDLAERLHQPAQVRPGQGDECLVAVDSLPTKDLGVVLEAVKAWAEEWNLPTARIRIGNSNYDLKKETEERLQWIEL